MFKKKQPEIRTYEVSWTLKDAPGLTLTQRFANWIADKHDDKFEIMETEDSFMIKRIK